MKRTGTSRGAARRDQPTDWKPRTKSKVALLRKVFNSDRKRRLDALLAQLSVLYEDLRIELTAITEDSMPKLDVLDPEGEDVDHPERTGAYRRHYFLRRSIATLNEFAVALRHLNEEQPEFKLISKSRGFNKEAEAIWSQAIEFFAVNEKLIKEIRHDVGGHFGEKAARYAVENFDLDTVGKVEMILDKDTGLRDPRLHFVEQIVATAIFRSLPGDPQQRFEELVQKCKDGYLHASNCVQLLLALYLLPQFGRS